MTKRKTAGVISLGCSKNRVDSERMLGMLRARGYEIVSDPARAELIIVNTCGFIQSAKEESIDAILEAARYKQTGRLKLLMVTGCLTQRYGKELREELPEVDAFLGVAEYEKLFAAIEQAESGARPLLCGEGSRFFDSPRVLTTPSYSAYVKLSDGCDNRCSYCAIPLIRGAYRSRALADVLNECEALARDGVSELTLIAQDTSRYGNDFPEKKLLLPDVLRSINGMEGVRWARVLYCYPDTVDERLLDAIAELSKVCEYLDLPLQHINRDLLRRMNRRGSPEHIVKLIEACRARGILVRTTMIVGFPGETDAQFQELCDFVREARFARLGAFTYSPEENTPAATMPDPVDEDVKNARLDQLMLLQQGISLSLNEARVGETAEALIEGYEDGHYVARTRLEAPEVDGCLYLTSRRDLAPGQYVRAKIKSADAYDLFGEEIK